MKYYPNLLVFSSIAQPFFLELITSIFLRIIIASRQNNVFYLVRGKINALLLQASPNLVEIADDFDALDLITCQFMEHLIINCESDKHQYVYRNFRRQIKNKLIELIRLEAIINEHEKQGLHKVYITDYQTRKLLSQIHQFRGRNSKPRIKCNYFLSVIYVTNSLIMRISQLVRSVCNFKLKRIEYYTKYQNSERNCICVTLPKGIPKEFYQNYLRPLEKKFDICCVPLETCKLEEFGYNKKYLYKKRKTNLGNFSWSMNVFNGNQFLTDCCVISHVFGEFIKWDLMLEDFFMYESRPNFLINRQQVSIANSILVHQARDAKLPIIGHMFEELYDFDELIINTESDLSKHIRFLLSKKKKKPRILGYRRQNYTKPQSALDVNQKYLDEIGITKQKGRKRIFYIAEPGELVITKLAKFNTEYSLMQKASQCLDITLVIKLHPSDNGALTVEALKRVGITDNIIIIGDTSRNKSYDRDYVKIMDEFDFGSAMLTSDIVISQYSTAILQSIVNGKKVAIVDMCNHGVFKRFWNDGYVFKFDVNSTFEELIAFENKPIDARVISEYGLISGQSPELSQILFEKMQDIKSALR